jgi:hypothetical protein
MGVSDRFPGPSDRFARRHRNRPDLMHELDYLGFSPANLGAKFQC